MHQYFLSVLNMGPANTADKRDFSTVQLSYTYVKCWTVFECAARHMSFAKAAEELNVTPAALSFQIRSLEQHLGAPVFRRLNRAVELTEEGILLRPGVQEGFSALQSAWRGAQRRLNSSTLTVTAGPGFTAKWLAPRMFSFAQQNPDIELRFSASLQMMDFERDDIDVAVRFGQGDDKNLFSKHIIDDWAAPMVAPELAEKGAVSFRPMAWMRWRITAPTSANQITRSMPHLLAVVSSWAAFP